MQIIDNISNLISRRNYEEHYYEPLILGERTKQHGVSHLFKAKTKVFFVGFAVSMVFVALVGQLWSPAGTTNQAGIAQGWMNQTSQWTGASNQWASAGSQWVGGIGTGAPADGTTATTVGSGTIGTGYAAGAQQFAGQGSQYANQFLGGGVSFVQTGTEETTATTTEETTTAPVEETSATPVEETTTETESATEQEAPEQQPQEEGANSNVNYQDYISQWVNKTSDWTATNQFANVDQWIGGASTQDNSTTTDVANPAASTQDWMAKGQEFGKNFWGGQAQPTSFVSLPDTIATPSADTTKPCSQAKVLGATFGLNDVTKTVSDLYTTGVKTISANSSVLGVSFDGTSQTLTIVCDVCGNTTVSVVSSGNSITLV